MANKCKYTEVKEGYWVYSIQIPSVNKYYIGISSVKKCSDRWRKSAYKGKSLEPYLDEWDSMIKTILVDGLTKGQAYQYEDNIIRALKMNDLCINTNRSGLIANDINTYQKDWYENNKEKHNQRSYQWRKEHPEYDKQYNKQWYENNKQKINEKRRQRYENDIEYRERKKQYSKQNRLKKKIEKE